MKKMILFLLFSIISVVTFAQVTDSTVVVNYSGDGALEILKNAMWPLILIAFSLLEAWLGSTGKIKANSTWGVILNFIKSFIKKKAGKVAVTVGVLFCLVSGLSVNAQSPFKGFFDNKKDVLHKNFVARSTDTLSNTSNGTFLFRGAATVSGFACPLKSSESVSSFQIVGAGLSYGYYTSSTYCKYAINAFAASSVKIGDESSTKLGGILTVGFFNNYFNVGIMYAAPSGTYATYITTGLTYTF